MSIVYVGGTSQSGGNANYAVSLTSLTGGIDTQPSAGDIVIVSAAVCSISSVNVDIQVLTSGYTEVADLYADDTYEANMSTNYKVMGATPDTSVTINASTNNDFPSSTVVQVWRGVDPTTPMDVTATTATGINTGIANGPAITPITTGAVVICTASAASANSSNTMTTVPSGYSNGIILGVLGNARYIASGIASKAWTSGVEDPGTWAVNTDISSMSWTSITLTLRPKTVPENLPMMHMMQIVGGII